MRRGRIALSIALTLATAALVAGCILTSGQILISFDLNTLDVTAPAAIPFVRVDLNTIEDYQEHKDKVNDLSDLALLGEITNNGSTALEVEFWMTPADPLPPPVTDTQVRNAAGAVQLWGPLSVGANATQRIDWDQSSAVFRGRAALLAQVKGDGIFTVYVLGPPSTTYSFRIDHGVLVLVIDAGL